MKKINHIWKSISTIGLFPGEESDLREVILLNKVSIVSMIAMTFFIPFEVVVNGWSIVPYEVGIIGIIGSIFIFHKYRLFYFAKYYFLTVATISIFALGVAVGGHTNNEYFQLCILVGGLMLFKKRSHYILTGIFCLSLLFLQWYLVDVIEPVIFIPESSKVQARPVFILMASILLFFEVYYFKHLNDEYQKELKRKNDEILSSINYAKRIQEAMLPANTYEQQPLGEHFIIYKPKDIVSGDFYWIQEIKDYVYVAVADCTGHGVPGGFLTMLGISFLNEIKLSSDDLLSPDQILNKLREKIVSDLSQPGEEGKTKDGMDISLLRINFKTNEVDWSGANNPLYIVRKQTKAVEVIKPDKQPIGYFIEPKPFKKHTLKLNSGDSLFLFSDGYADQFGGPRNKKFGYKRFRNIITTNFDQSFEMQKNKLETLFEEWKGTGKQIDDVCVIGVKL